MTTVKMPMKMKRAVPVLTKLTARFYQPMYRCFNERMHEALLRRDAFLDRVIACEVPRIEADLEGTRMSPEAHRYVAGCLKQMGGSDAGELWQVSLSMQHSTADELRRVTEKFNLVRDALLNRMVMLLCASDGLLTKLDLPLRTDSTHCAGTEGMTTSPIRAIEDAQTDPFYYLWSGCVQRHGCGLYRRQLPSSLNGFACHLPDDKVPNTAAYARRVAQEEAGAEERRRFLAEWDDWAVKDPDEEAADD